MPYLEHVINLDLRPAKRWEFLADYKAELDELLTYYLNDLSGAELIFAGISAYKQQLIATDYLEEIDYIASISRFSGDQVLTANLYYDILKFYFGCTAFAVDTQKTIYHARNLDWHTENDLLSKHSRIFNFQRNGTTVFKTVGWLGFIGALSGNKPGAFSITLNAVLSNDPPQMATPISFLLRNILDSCPNFQEAQTSLENTVIVSDCLLLLSGIQPNEMVVIERTPTRFCTRLSTNGYIVVTNDYKLLTNHIEGSSILQTTSCGRYNRAEELLAAQLPVHTKDCLAILQDHQVKMNITVQQMVFNNTTGEIELVKTAEFAE
jgi:acid ceramidase